MNPMTPASPKDRIIFALDVEHFHQALHWVTLLKDRVGIFKVGKQLFTHSGPKVIDMICQKRQKVFLDLKYHDIPNTVAKAGEEAIGLVEEVKRAALNLFQGKELAFELIYRPRFQRAIKARFGAISCSGLFSCDQF